MRANTSIYSDQARKIKSQMSDETTKLENMLKQEQIAHDQTKKDLLALEEKDKENETFLIKEAKRSKKINEELAGTRDQLKEQENELRKTVELLKSNFKPDS